MNIVIVGGGTAGWLSALFLSKAHPNNKYTVIESSCIGVIGTGEGSTAMLTGVLQGNFFNFGCNIYDFVKATGAKPKLGIKFKNWINDDFFSPIDGSIYDEQIPDPALLYAIEQNIPGHLITRNGIRLENKILPFTNLDSMSYFDGVAWHFDGHKVGQYFKSVCDSVEVIDAKVIDHKRDNNGNVHTIILDNSSKIENIDLLIDCSGFNSIFKLDSDGFEDMSQYLPVDTAIPFQIPNDDIEDTPNYTESIAMDNGWIWKIPVGERYGCGYVYSSRFTDEKSAVQEASKLFECKPIKTIKFRSGFVEKFWNNNVIKIGLSGGFLEPLQATAIPTMISQLHTLTFELFRHTQKLTNNEANRIAFNNYSKGLMLNFVDLINLHYKTGRDDTDFWKYMQTEESTTEKNKEILKITKNRVPTNRDLPNIGFNAGINLFGPIIAGLKLVKPSTAKEELEFIYSKIDIDINQKLLQLDKEVKSISYINMKDFINFFRN